jgi:hypothetical protein
MPAREQRCSLDRHGEPTHFTDQWFVPEGTSVLGLNGRIEKDSLVESFSSPNRKRGQVLAVGKIVTKGDLGTQAAKVRWITTGYVTHAWANWLGLVGPVEAIAALDEEESAHDREGSGANCGAREGE